MKQRALCALLLASTYLTSTSSSICHNSCSGHGKCDRWGRCTCFDGYQGNDCSKRVCPTGPQYSDIPYATDKAHQVATCSGKGSCDYLTGLCKCEKGYSGRNCGHLDCFNGCNGRGRCMSLREAAEFNDGYLFNRTTSYSKWDADTILGCYCDFGWSGSDCSQRVCEYGVDPRLSTQANEVVTLVCKCNEGAICSGKFKLQFLGRPFDSWLYPTSRAYQIADGLMKIPGVYANSSVHSFVSVDTYNTSLADKPICAQNATIKTAVSFRRNLGDLPAISFYANLISGGSMYFETSQTIVCDCRQTSCNGTFRLSFDGEMSSRIHTLNSGADVVSALQGMNTIRAAGVSIISGSNSAICTSHLLSNLTITFQASKGNIPRLGLMSSVVADSNPEHYTTANATNVLTLRTLDGRDDHVKLCNGIGSCNFASGSCSCPFGWEFDADKGSCGKLTIDTSSWHGLARCPGIVSMYADARVGSRKDLSGRQNFGTRIYISVNPSDHSSRSGRVRANRTQSAIYSYGWNPTLESISISESARTLLLNMSSNSSAGPMVLDQAKNKLFYVDANPAAVHIGVLYLDSATTNSSVWLYVSHTIFGLAMDAHFNRRKLYWTSPGSVNTADGKIYWAYMDANPPVAHSLVSSIGQANLIDPHGIAVHYIESKLYWVDRDSYRSHSVLRSCNFDGSGYTEVYIYRTVGNHTVSTNVTDLLIDFSHNNTAMFIDAGHPPAIIATNLDAPIFYNNLTTDDDQVQGYQTTRIIASTYSLNISSPRFLAVDEMNQLLLWSDTAYSKRTVGFARYKKLTIAYDSQAPGIALKYTSAVKRSTPNVFDYPVGLLIDRGLGPPQWGNYLDCYGNGKCTGLSGNFVCECYAGFFGDCQARTCPTGPAWFHEPIVNNVAHDELMECSNMGICDRATGRCNCRSGFEGPACERMTCAGDDNPCSGRGRCMSMRHLASQHLDVASRSSWPVEYGQLPHNPDTWDADMIYGCAVDMYGYTEGYHNISSYTGSSLDRRDCPNGFNHRMIDKAYSNGTATVANFTQYREVQRLTCGAIVGSFRLQFRGDISTEMSFNVTASALQDALMAMPTVGAVSVKYSLDKFSGASNSSLCRRHGGSYADVTFLSELGYLPLLTVYGSTLYGNTLSISKYQSGSQEGLMECAGYGDCDTTTGDCHCWDYHGTSDGFGGEGTRGDCGYNLIH